MLNRSSSYTMTGMRSVVRVSRGGVSGRVGGSGGEMDVAPLGRRWVELVVCGWRNILEARYRSAQCIHIRERTSAVQQDEIPPHFRAPSSVARQYMLRLSAPSTWIDCSIIFITPAPGTANHRDMQMSLG